MSLGENFFLLSSLPIPAEPGRPPPLSTRDLRERAAASDAARLVDVVLLSDDLRQRQAVLVGELADAEPAVLSADQASGRAPLPRALALDDTVESSRLPADRVWDAYWRLAARVARAHGSPFLRAWVRMEVALRNGLAAARATSLGQSFRPHQVAAELGPDPTVVERTVAAWAAAADPLAGWRSLLLARWEWATREEPAFSFGRDEVAAYAVKLLVLHDWRRTMGVAA